MSPNKEGKSKLLDNVTTEEALKPRRIFVRLQTIFSALTDTKFQLAEQKQGGFSCSAFSTRTGDGGGGRREGGDWAGGGGREQPRAAPSLGFVKSPRHGSPGAT